MQPVDAIIPEAVKQATEFARSAGFTHSSLNETGRLLAVLTASHPTGRIAEIGTGYGVGAAWVSSALALTAQFFTVELDPTRAAVARKLLAGRSNITVLEGDWRAILEHGPFDLIFADGGKAKENGAEELIAALAVGGTLVLDDFTPEHVWTEAERALWANDPLRHFWLTDPRLAATEIMVAPRSSVILATRLA